MKSKGKIEGEREGAHRGVGNEGKHNPWSIEHGSPFDTFGYFPQPVHIVGRSRFFLWCQGGWREECWHNADSAAAAVLLVFFENNKKLGRLCTPFPLIIILRIFEALFLAIH